MVKSQAVLVEVAPHPEGRVARLVTLPGFAKDRQAIEVGNGTKIIPIRYLNGKPPYPDLKLKEDEAIAVTKWPWFHLWPQVIALLGLGFGLATWVANLQPKDTTLSSLRWIHNWWAPPFIAIAAVLLAYSWYLHWWSDVWYITARTIVKRKHLWQAQKEWSLAPNDVGVVEEKTIWPKIFFSTWLCVGSIKIEVGGKLGSVTVNHVGRYGYIMEAIECINRSTAEAAHETARLQKQTEENIERLLAEVHKLRENGGVPGGIDPALQQDVATLRGEVAALREAFRILISTFRLDPSTIITVFGIDLAGRLEHMGALPHDSWPSNSNDDTMHGPTTPRPPKADGPPADQASDA